MTLLSLEGIKCEKGRTWNLRISVFYSAEDICERFTLT